MAAAMLAALASTVLATLTGGAHKAVSHGPTASGTTATNGARSVRTSLPLGLSGVISSGGGYSLQSGQAVQSTVKFATLDLGAAHAYPVPWRQRLHAGRPVTFTGLPRQAKIKIYTLSGELVRELDKDDPGTTLTWDVRDGAGREAFSGVYHFWVRDPSTGESRKGKLMVIR